MKSRLVGNKSPLVLPACSMMVGIVVGAYVTAPVPLWGLLAAAVVLALLLWRWALAQSVAVMVCFVLLGWLLVDRQQRLLRVDWPEGEVDYEAVVVSEPVEKPKTVAVDILLTESGRRLKCYLHKDGWSRSVRIGDGLRIRSRIRQNSDWRRGTFDYRRYLEIHGFTGSTFVAGWKWQKAEVSLAHVSRLERTRLYFLKLRSRLLERIRMDDEAAYAVVAAMTLGDKSALTQELKEVYAVTGASHVLALSGLHLGIIYGFLSLFVFSRWRSLMQVLLVLSIGGMFYSEKELDKKRAEYSEYSMELEEYEADSMKQVRFQDILDRMDQAVEKGDSLLVAELQDSLRVYGPPERRGVIGFNIAGAFFMIPAVAGVVLMVLGLLIAVVFYYLWERERNRKR